MHRFDTGMEDPLISVVTPSYNQSKFIEDLICSIIEQDHSNVEHIIIDGGSTDGTVDILKEYEKKYDLKWISEPDDGIPNAINKGIEMANGEYIGIQNSDDYYLSGAFSRYENIIDSTSADVIYGDQLFVNAEKNIIGLRVHTRPSKFIQKHWHHFASSHTIIIKKKTLIDIGKINQDYKYLFDGELFWRLLTKSQATTFVHDPHFLAARRKHENIISNTHGEPEQYAWEQNNLYTYSDIEEIIPNKLLFITAIILKTGYLIAEGNSRSLYNMYLDLINKSLYNFGYDSLISFGDS